MSEDARFADGALRPLRLLAYDEADLQVVGALAQDAVFPASETSWRPRERRFAVLLNRFRWEEKGRRPPERVRSLLVVDEAVAVASDGVERGEGTVLSLLSISFEPGPECEIFSERHWARDGDEWLDAVVGAYREFC